MEKQSFSPCFDCAKPCSSKALVTTNFSKNIYCFLGMPGSGKSTQIEILKQSIGYPAFRIGKYAKSVGATKRVSMLLYLHKELIVHLLKA
jgi:predicted ATPase